MYSYARRERERRGEEGRAEDKARRKFGSVVVDLEEGKNGQVVQSHKLLLFAPFLVGLVCKRSCRSSLDFDTWEKLSCFRCKLRAMAAAVLWSACDSGIVAACTLLAT